MKTGFIGLGQMGSQMAGNLIKAGHEVIVYNRTKEKVKPLTDKGAQPAQSVKDACRSEVVITMLSDDKAVENVVFKSEGILESLGQNAIHISMSTISMALAMKLQKEHESAGQHFISAPVFGRPEAAAAAKLFIVAAGKRELVDRCIPLFEAMGQKHFHIGDKPFDANLVKLSGNFLIASVIEALGEAMALVGKAGIDRAHYLEILTSTLFSAPVYKTYGSQIVEGKFKPAGFAAPLGQKDIGLAIAAAEKLKVPMPLASLLHDRFLTLMAQNGETLDWSAIAQLSLIDSGQKNIT